MRRLVHCTLPPELVHRPILHDLVRATSAVVNVRRANVDVESGVAWFLLELSGPGGFVTLLGDAARYAVGLTNLMAGIHFIGINAPPDVEELPVLSLLRTTAVIPLRQSIARGVVVGRDLATSSWLVEAHRVLLRGRRFVAMHETPELPIGLEKLAVAKGLWVGEKK